MKITKQSRSVRNKAAHAARMAEERPDVAIRAPSPVEEPKAPDRPTLKAIPYNKVALTEAQRQAVSQAILDHYPRNQIARALGVTVKTLARLIKDDPRLTDAADAAKDQEEAELRDCLMAMARKGSEVAALFLLKSRHGYVDRPDPKGKPDGFQGGVLVVPAPLGSEEDFDVMAVRQQAQFRQRSVEEHILPGEIRTSTDQGHGVVMQKTSRADLPPRH